MERESFEDEEVAGLLNRYFIAIKVDREERPDVDHIYMSVCQALTGSGGWPLTIVMTPDKKPFFAGTYFPKHGKWGRPGLIDILNRIQEQWGKNRSSIVEYGDKITESLHNRPLSGNKKDLSFKLLNTAYAQLEKSFDSTYGGFGPAPKFPTPHNLMFLLRYWLLSGKDRALAMVEKTLDAMRRGGIYDHLGYGFARYSVDDKWLVPHFEKMLYDNALLCYTYLEAYQCTGRQDFAAVSEEIIAYVLRDMTGSQGEIYSAEDADSEGVEGKFYVWTKQEIYSLLGPEHGKLFAGFYNVTEQGNFEHGTSILNNIRHTVSEYAAEAGVEPAKLCRILAEGRKKLFSARQVRIPPFKDDKVLTSWNALMIAALAKAARVLAKDEYAQAAARGIDFIYSRLMREDGRLLARYRAGQAAHLAYLDDYAFLLWALIELYEATYKPVYIEKAVKLSRDMERLFWDEQNGGFYFYGADGEELITRPKELYDGATPSGNSVAALSLLRLARLADNSRLAEMAEKCLVAFSAQAAEYPRAFTYYLMAVDYYLTAPRQIVVAGKRTDGVVRDMLAVVGKQFLPHTSVLLNDSEEASRIERVLPWLLDKTPIDSQAAAYVCGNFACQPPVKNVPELVELISRD